MPHQYRLFSGSDASYGQTMIATAVADSNDTNYHKTGSKLRGTLHVQLPVKSNNQLTRLCWIDGVDKGKGRGCDNDSARVR